jgi:hypothetical protein
LTCGEGEDPCRLAEAFGFEMLSAEGLEAGAKHLLKRGCR